MIETKWTDLQRGWLAGLIDGEGCITFIPGQRKTEISITNTSLLLLQQAKEIIGNGHIYALHKIKESHNTCYQLRICQQVQIKRIIEATIDMLIVKKPKAQMLLDRINERLEYIRLNGVGGFRYVKK